MVVSGLPLHFSHRSSSPFQNHTYDGTIDYSIRNTKFIVKLSYKDEDYDLQYVGWPEEKTELIVQMAVVAATAEVVAGEPGGIRNVERVVGALTDGRRWAFVKLEGGSVVWFSKVLDLSRGDLMAVVKVIVASAEGW
jgi:hypothetical protein